MSSSTTLKSTKKLHSVAFNPSQGVCLSGTISALQIHTTFPLVEHSKIEFPGGITLAEMLGNSNIIALVTAGPDKVIIYDDEQKAAIAQLSFESKVRAVRMRKELLVVVVDKHTFVYKFDGLQLLEIHQTCTNLRGLVALNPTGNLQLLACLCKEHGNLKITLYNKKKSNTIHCHENMIAAVALSHDGELIATASQRGTLIRVVWAMNGTVYKEFRRGSDTADIYHLIFDVQRTKLAVSSSNKSTIHIFVVEEDGDDKNLKKSSLMGSLFKKSSYFNSATSYAQVTLKDTSADNKAVCAFSPDGRQLFIAQENGNYHEIVLKEKKCTAHDNGTLVMGIF